MHLGAITDIGQARGVSPRNTARGVRLASGSPGEGAPPAMPALPGLFLARRHDRRAKGHDRQASSPWACRFVILTASATVLGWSIRKAGLNAHRLGSRLEEWGRR